MNYKTPLAEKSIKFIVLELIGFIFCFSIMILLIIKYFQTSYIEFFIFGIIFIVLFMISGYLTINTLIKPRIVIEYDASGIYLHYSKKRTVYILIKDIENVKASISYARFIAYSFGILIVQTKTKKYKIGIIKDVQKVEKYIYSRIAYKYKRVR